MNVGSLDTATFNLPRGWLATFALRRGIEIFELGSGARRLAIAAVSHASVFHHPITFSPSGNLLALWMPSEYAVVVFSAVDGARVATLRHPSIREVVDIAFAPDESAVGVVDEEWVIWSLASHEVTAAIEPAHYCNTFAFANAGPRFVTSSFDTLEIWNWKTARRELQLQHAYGDVGTFAFSPDDGKIAVGSCDNRARILDARTGAVLWVIEHEDDVDTVSFDRTGARFLSQSRTTIVTELATGKTIAESRRASKAEVAASFTDDGGVVTVDYDGTVSWLTF